MWTPSCARCCWRRRSSINRRRVRVHGPQPNGCRNRQHAEAAAARKLRAAPILPAVREVGPAKDFFSNIGKFLSGKFLFQQANFRQISRYAKFLFQQANFRQISRTAGTVRGCCTVHGQTCSATRGQRCLLSKMLNNYLVHRTADL